MHNTAQIRPNGWREKNWVSSAQSCSEGSESIEQTFMDKGVVSQGTKDEKNKKVEAAGRELSTQQQKILAIWEKWQERKATKKAEIVKRTK